MSFIAQGKTNWKFLIIITVIAFVIGGKILWYMNNQQFAYQVSEIQKLENVVKDKTADWQTYINEEYGFEIQYPRDWFETHFYDKSIVEFQSTDKKLYISTGGVCSDCTNEEGARIEIFVKDNPKKLSTVDFVNQEFNWYVENNEIEINKKEIAEAVALEVKTKVDFGAGWPIIYISKDNKIFVINYSQTSGADKEKYLSVFKQIISTFNFLR